MKNQTENKGEIVIYKTEDGVTGLDVRLQDESVWLTQAQIGQLFGKGTPAINEHIKNVFKTGELAETATIRKFRIVRKEGKRLVERELDFYNLDMIIAVGYRVNSKKGTQFRIWATTVLRDHLVKGYTLNEKRLQENRQRLKELEDAVALVEKAKTSLSRTIHLSMATNELLRSCLFGFLRKIISCFLRMESGRLTTMHLLR